MSVNKAMDKYLKLSQEIMLKNYGMTDGQIKRVLLNIDFKDLDLSQLNYKGEVIKGSPLDKLIALIQDQFKVQLKSVIEKGVYQSWIGANQLFEGMLKFAYRNPPEYYAKISNFNKLKNRQLFKGRTLSGRIWTLSNDYKRNIKDALQIGYYNGDSAVDVAKRVMRYSLSAEAKSLDIEKLTDKEVVKALKGIKPNVKGSLGSVFKDAKRLAGNERNIAFREAENSNMDSYYVLGFRINLSGSHPRRDICDYAEGDYPKTFKWNGWHPNCLCNRTYILMSVEQMKAHQEALRRGESPQVKMITEIPKQFKLYLQQHYAQMNSWKSKPYFMVDNDIAKLIS